MTFPEAIYLLRRFLERQKIVSSEIQKFNVVYLRGSLTTITTK